MLQITMKLPASLPPLIVCLTAAGLASPAFSEDKPQPAPAKKQPAGALKWRVQQLNVDNNEGCAVADFDKDGHLDVSAGEYWYPGPDFKEKKPLRELAVQPPDYLTNNAEHAWDVNGDGWPDVVSSSFMQSEKIGRASCRDRA